MSGYGLIHDGHVMAGLSLLDGRRAILTAWGQAPRGEKPVFVLGLSYFETHPSMASRSRTEICLNGFGRKTSSFRRTCDGGGAQRPQSQVSNVDAKGRPTYNVAPTFADEVQR